MVWSTKMCTLSTGVCHLCHAFLENEWQVQMLVQLLFLLVGCLLYDLCWLYDTEYIWTLGHVFEFSLSKLFSTLLWWHTRQFLNNILYWGSHPIITYSRMPIHKCFFLTLLVCVFGGGGKTLPKSSFSFKIYLNIYTLQFVTDTIVSYSQGLLDRFISSKEYFNTLPYSSYFDTVFILWCENLVLDLNFCG